ncbi:guanine nucleotide-binding protein subunit gamma 2-like isoform X2 [Salvia miltiorrhiza]|uniref:guanine nucleotide-binding protein subunit gamma 2-like isoform X2 n=1 Tax=Salvia miltiorrhiza TaxID=226208 RepID=UPI0025AD4E0B|nr:guanine nucleotide-binding protein subunit gamma 2-like isoform X2 [Salvia miltiorrhiza]
MDRAPPQAAEQPHNPTPPASSAMPSSTSGHMGKHRMLAAISFLNQQIQIMQDELLELETIGGVSTVCPETRAPAEADWDRWFQGAQSSRSRRRWI